MSNTAPATNGYVIRLDLLKMAKEMLEQDWHAQRDTLQQHWQHEVELAKIKAHARDSLIESVPPAPTLKPFPTEAEVIAKAKALNEFINTK
jgi:hypothetical protein